MFEVGLIIGLVVGFAIGFYLATIYTVHKLTKEDERDNDKEMDRNPFTKQITLTPAAVEILEKVQREPGIKVDTNPDRLKEGERAFKKAFINTECPTAESSDTTDIDNCIISFIPGEQDKKKLLRCGNILFVSYPAKSVQEGIEKFLEDPHYKISGANQDCTILCAKLYPHEAPVGCAKLREQQDVHFLMASFKSMD